VVFTKPPDDNHVHSRGPTQDAGIGFVSIAPNILDDRLQRRPSLTRDQTLVVGEDGRRDGLRSIAPFQVARIQIEDVGVVTLILGADFVEPLAANELHRRIGCLAKEVHRAGRLRDIRVKRRAQEHVLSESADFRSPSLERIDRAVEARNDDEGDFHTRIVRPAIDDGSKRRSVVRRVDDDVSTDAILRTCRLSPRTDRKALDHFVLISLVEAERLTRKRRSWARGTQLSPCPILLERYSSR